MVMVSKATPTRRRQPQEGFVYVAVLFALAVVGVGLATAGTWVSREVQRDREYELRRAGQELMQAIGRYYQSSPGARKVFPQQLEDLVEDRRFISIRRHIRRLPLDPFTGRADWILVPSFDGRVSGVRSRSDAVATTRLTLNGEVYPLGVPVSQWRFEHVPLSEKQSSIR